MDVAVLLSWERPSFQPSCLSVILPQLDVLVCPVFHQTGSGTFHYLVGKTKPQLQHPLAMSNSQVEGKMAGFWFSLELASSSWHMPGEAIREYSVADKGL